MDNKILVKVKADITDLNQKLDSAGKNLDKWSKDTMGGFTSLAKGIGAATLRFAAMTAPITAAGAAIFAMMQKTANTGEELHRMSQKTGLTVEELYNLKQVAEFSDVSLGDLDLRLKDLARNLFEARNKAGEARDIFKALGIDTSKSLNQVLMDLAKRFAEMEDGEGKLAIVTQLFGRNAQDIIPVLNDLASGAHKVAGSFSEEAAEAAQKFNDNITQLRQNMAKFTQDIGNEYIPIFNKLFNTFSSWYEKIDTTIDKALDATLGKPIPEINFPIINEAVKKPAPAFTAEEQQQKEQAERRKWMEWEWKYADTVDRTGQEILNNLEKKDRAIKEHTQALQTARESAIQLQLKEVDLAEQEFRISKSGAVEERVRLYDELKRIQEEYIAGLDKVNDPASWYAQMNAINDTREALVQLNLKLKEQTGTLAEGMQYGIQQWLHDAKTGFEHGKTIAQDTANAMQDFFSSISFDAMQGKLKTLGDYFRNFITSMQRSVSNILGQLFTQLAVTGISSLFGGFSLGGGGGASLGGLGGAPVVIHSGGYIPRFHAGGLSADEVPAILQRGEYVINRRAVDAVGKSMLDNINTGRGAGRASNNYFIIDPEAAEAYSKMSDRQIEARISKLMKDNRLKQIRR